MTTATAPPVRRRLVGGALRRYRENLGWALEDAARVLGCDKSKISRIETGQRGIRAAELRGLLAEYGIGEQAQEVLAAIVAPRAASGWWRVYADMLPEACQDVLALEAAASRIAACDACRIPDLLQTPDYTRALAEADPGLPSDAARDRAVEATLARQHAILTERQTPLTAVIAETALRQAAGEARAMHAQLAALADMGDSGQAAIRVLPSGHGAHAAVTGSFTILYFTQAAGLAIVHQPGLTGGHCLDSPADVAAYARAFEQLRAWALSPATSAARLRELAAG